MGKRKPPAVPNPSQRGGLRPVHLITDRAKRYRSQANAAPASHCYLCGEPKPMDVEHIDGHEANTNPENLARSCRSCNATKGAAFKRLGKGSRTRQFNPAKPRRSSKNAEAAGAKSLAQYINTIMVLKGWSDAMPLENAIAIMHATPAADRSRYAAELYQRRRESGKVPAKREEVPF